MTHKICLLFVFCISLFTVSCDNKINDTASVIVNHTPEKQEVLNAVLRLHDGMRQKDGTLAMSAWHEKASSYNININKDGSVKQVLDSPEVNLEGIKNWLDTTTDALDEEIFDVEIFIDGQLAMAWIPYKFYRNKTFTHSGTNAFTLVNVNDVWKIVSVTDTRYFEK